jgi:hypothetical protein
MSFNITIQNIDPLLEALARYPDIAEPILHDATDRALLNLVPSLAFYPAELPGQRYVRTGNLGSGWTDAQPQWQALSSGFEGTLDNPTPYSPVVQGATTQAQIHAGRWATDQQIVNDHTVETEAIYNQALQQIADAIDQKVGA